jgi:hypothetical protein
MKKAITLCDQCQADIDDEKGIVIRAECHGAHSRTAAPGYYPVSGDVVVVLKNRNGIATFKAGIDLCSFSCAAEWAAGLAHVKGHQ